MHMDGMVAKKSKTSPDLLHLIAQFLEPNPVVYTALAMVNKDFYSVFTSDKYWAALDAYRKRSGIFKHFLQVLPSFERLMVAFWGGMEFEEDFDIEKINSKYVQLGYYAKSSYVGQDEFGTLYGIPSTVKVFTNDNWTLKLLIDLNPFTFTEFTEKSRDNEDLAYRACSKKFGLVTFASHRIYRNEALLHRIVKAGHRDDIMQFMPFIFYRDPGLAKYILKVHPEPASGVSNPSSIASAPAQFRTDKANILYALKFIDEETYADWYCEERVKNKAIFSDPDIIAAIVDNGFLCVPDENYSRFAGINKLIQLCDDYDWIKERIKAGPGTWVLASDRLQENKSLLMLALETTEAIIHSPEGLIKRQRLLFMPLLPEIFTDDNQVIRKAFQVFGLGIVPRGKRTKSMVREHFKTFGSVSNILFPDKDSYELIQEAILLDARHVVRARCDLEKVRRDPILRPALEKSKHLIGYELIEVGLGMVFLFLYGNLSIMENMDKWSQVQLLVNYPDDFIGSKYRWANDVDVVAEAVKIDRGIFWRLPKSLQNTKRIQKSLGPKVNFRNCPLPRFHI